MTVQVARHATVCFLTRGALWVSWEEGKCRRDAIRLPNIDLIQRFHYATRNESVRWAFTGRWLVSECWDLDVDELLVVLPIHLPSLLSCQLRTQGRSQWRLHSKVPSSTEELSYQVHPRTLDCAKRRPAESQMHHWSTLPTAHRRPSSRGAYQSGAHETGIQRSLLESFLGWQ